MLDMINEDLNRLGLFCSPAKVCVGRAVCSCFLRFANLLYPLGLGVHPHQNLSVKVEIDTNPPGGGRVVEYFHNGPIMFTVNHHDLPSLFAGKLHAVLFRGFVKGRDYFDLMLFLSKKVPFNARLLRNATLQTHPDTMLESIDGIVQRLKMRLNEVDEKTIAGDLEPFLLEPEDLRFITPGNLVDALERNMADGVFLREW